MTGRRRRKKGNRRGLRGR
uniref:Uncharacterized protein n=1 Tax=Arundo donax TaxID=35708 RepID=A0A0A9BA09_ARUDO